MQLIEFLKHYPDEESCINHFKAIRDKAGINCEKCGCTNHYWLRRKLSYECKGCKTRSSLRTGTALAYTKLSFFDWYLTIHLMTSTKKGFSALELQRQLGKKRYEPVFRMMHKIRTAMGARDNRYFLKDMVELDDCYVTTTTKKRKSYKRGKGSEKQTKVTVMVEAVAIENLEEDTKSSRLGFVKAKVNTSEKSEEINSLMSSNIDPKSVLFTDKSKSYLKIHEHAETHVSTLSSDLIEKGEFMWMNTIISNFKKVFLANHHSISEKFLQNYIDEFCYKLNRRYFRNKLMDRALIAASCI